MTRRITQHSGAFLNHLLPFNNILRSPFDASIHDCPDIFDKIVYPYNINAFDFFLDKHDLTIFYPNLITNSQRGFPLGPMPDLPATHIIPNLPTTLEYPSAVDAYLKIETAAGQTSGPFSHEMVERILRGPFQSSPLIVAVLSLATSSWRSDQAADLPPPFEINKCGGFRKLYLKT